MKLLFVGITRAKYALTISFADMEETKPNQITKYLAELEDYHFDKKTFEYKEDDFTKEFFRSISRDVYDNQKAFREEIEERIQQTVLSPSRLNDYLACPREFFYTKILGIDVEETDWDNANFGTTVHKMLETAVRISKDKGEYPTQEEITEQFYKIFNTQKFTTPQAKEKFEKRGMEVIEKYYPYFTKIEEEMNNCIEKITKKRNELGKTLARTQELWENYSIESAKIYAEKFNGGSAYNYVFYTHLNDLARVRLEYLNETLYNIDNEMFY